MKRARSLALSAAALLLIAAALPALGGCSRSARSQTFADGQRAAQTTPSAESTAATGSPATAGPNGSGSTGSGGSGGSGSGGASSSAKLSSKDASALDAELSAIQNELDRLSLPSDSDFDSIESGLE